MSANVAYLRVEGGVSQRTPLTLIYGRTLGFAKLAEPIDEFTRVPGFLRSRRSAPLSRRIPLAVTEGGRERVANQLCDYVFSSAVADGCWIEVESSFLMMDQQPVVVMLLSESQCAALGTYGETTGVILPTGQVIDALFANGGNGGDVPQEYGCQDLALPNVELGSEMFQLSPSSEFTRELRAKHSYYAVLHDSHRKRFGKGYCVVENPYPDPIYPQLRGSFPVVIHYSAQIDPSRVALDDTISLAIGLRLGEPCRIGTTEKAANIVDRWTFSYRHAVCRVTTAATVDMERPVARTPQSVFDVLGIAPGSKIVVESGSIANRHSSVARLIVSALVERGEGIKVQGSAPDFLDIVGIEDLPSIALDLDARKKLGVAPGSPIYVRPHIAAVLTNEATTVLLLLAAAVVGSIAAEALILTVVISVLYLLVALLIASQRLR